MGQSFVERRLSRAVCRARVGRWIERLRVAEGLVWLAGAEAQAITDVWEFLRCVF